MSQQPHEPEGSRYIMSASLSRRITPRNVRPRMADKERAQRIRTLKKQHPGMTWRHIADEVGVDTRSAQAWRKTGGISAKNAVKLAEVFGVSYEFLWFGKEKGPTPDLLAGVSRIDQVDAVRDEFRDKVDKITAQLAAVEIDIESQNANLAQQTDLLERIQAAVTQQAAVLADLTAVVAQLPELREIARTLEALRARDASDRRGRPILPAAAPDPPEEEDDSQRAD
jgi:transcriptional regulator with XRE-family HTH domain